MVETQWRDSESKGRAGTAAFCVDKQKANGFILGFQQMFTDEIQVESYTDLQPGEGGKKQRSPRCLQMRAERQNEKVQPSISSSFSLQWPLWYKNSLGFLEATRGHDFCYQQKTEFLRLVMLLQGRDFLRNKQAGEFLLGKSSGQE